MLSHTADTAAIKRISKWGFMLASCLVLFWFAGPVLLRVPLIKRVFTLTVQEPLRLTRDGQGSALVKPALEPVLAPIDGIVTVLVQHGQWAAAGGVVAEMSAGKTSLQDEVQLLYAPRGGLVTLRLSHFLAMPPDNPYIMRQDGDYLAAFEPVLGLKQSLPLVLELIDHPFNDLPLLDAKIFIAKKEGCAVGSVDLDWQEGSGFFDHTGAFIIELVKFPQEWLDDVVLDCFVRVVGAEGYVLPKRALYSFKGLDNADVLVFEQGRIKERPVKIIDYTKNSVVVSGLAAHDKVLSYPKIFRYRFRGEGNHT